MSKVRTHSASTDLVPISERIRYMQLLRLGVAVVVLLASWLVPGALGAGFDKLALVTVAYVVASLAGEAMWRFTRRSTVLFGTLLIVDGLYLAWISYLTGGLISPFRFLILLHLISVALLASYRTGLMLALWHSLLLFIVFNAQEAGILNAPTDAIRALPGSEFQRIIAFSVALWLVTIATSTFSAINERELRRRRFDLERLAKMATDLEAADDAPGVADVLLTTVVDAFDFGRVLMFGSPEEDLHLMGHRGDVGPARMGASPGNDSVIRRARDDKETLLVTELEPGTDPCLASMLPDARNVVVGPLSAEGRSVGVLIVEHSLKSGSRIERRVVGMLERFASHAALAMLNASLLEKVQRMASTDGLTMIANRRTFDASLQREINRVSRGGEQLSLIMLDLDHFKMLNDTYGHQKGDDVLHRVARVLEGECRDFDTVARYGGEEFGIIIPNTAGEEAVLLARRLAEAIRRCYEDITLTVSMGVASYPYNAGDPEGLVAAADESLYASKRGGRDQVTRSTRTPNVVGLEEARKSADGAA
ncbi:MAG: diguanylate cyclase [Actinomycetota bacterium]|nr:diguanylate cyclase [Actinomycetota bacterium]